MRDKKITKWIIGTDEVGCPSTSSGRASPRSHKYIIGIDEAGRGPLAGPVVVAGIKINQKFYPEQGRRTKFWKGIKDSKKLTPKQREEWFRVLTNHAEIEWAVARVWPKVIDRINITQASNLGARRVCAKLSFDGGNLSLAHVLLDGSLHLPPDISHEIIIKGDEKVPVISAASIIAKVTRDRLMRRLHKKYPQYGFDVHKGYGTKLHRRLLRTNGLSVMHRKSFCWKLIAP